MNSIGPDGPEFDESPFDQGTNSWECDTCGNDLYSACPNCYLEEKRAVGRYEKALLKIAYMDQSLGKTMQRIAREALQGGKADE